MPRKIGGRAFWPSIERRFRRVTKNDAARRRTAVAPHKNAGGHGHRLPGIEHGALSDGGGEPVHGGHELLRQLRHNQLAEGAGDSRPGQAGHRSRDGRRRTGHRHAQTYRVFPGAVLPAAPHDPGRDQRLPDTGSDRTGVRLDTSQECGGRVHHLHLAPHGGAVSPSATWRRFSRTGATSTPLFPGT